MTSHPSRSYTLKTSSARQLRVSHPPPSSGRCAWQLRSPVFAHVLDFSFCSVVGGASLLYLAAFVYARKLSSSLRLFYFSLLPYPHSCLVFCSRDVGSAVPPRIALSIFCLRGEYGAYSQAPLLAPGFRGGAVLYCTVLYCTPVLIYGRWHGQPDLWIQLAVHCRCHWLCRYDHSTPGLLTVSSVTSTVWVHPGREAAGVELVHGVQWGSPDSCRYLKK